MYEYLPKNIMALLNRRQLGLPLKENGRSVRHNRNNYRCNYELLKTLLHDKHLYLEVIACRRVSRGEQPSFCHNRLFTNKYKSWFNLCTSPTAGPSLMKTNVFSTDEISQGEAYSSSTRLKVVDAVTLDPPNGCVPLPNSQHLPCILFLTKDQWLYQYSLVDASFLSKIYIPTNCFADKLCKSNSSEQPPTRIECEERVCSIDFNYQYVTINGDSGRVLVRSAVATAGRETYVAYALVELFPLRFLSHFVTRTSGNNLKAELWNDIFVLTAKTGSTVSLYGIKDIAAMHQINSSHIQLKRSVSYRGTYFAEIGSRQIGLPYTLKVIDLDKWKDWSSFQLFKTKALKHIFRVGGVPFHYAVPIDKSCTSWSLRSLADSKEVSKFHVEEKYDNSHVAGFDFHSDDSGRILLVNKDTVTVYRIDQVRKVATRSSGPSCSSSKHSAPQNKSPRKCDPVKIISSSPIAEPDFQLRVIGSVHSVTPSNNFKPKVIKCFEIKIDHKEQIELETSSRSSDCSDETDVLTWQYPSDTPRLGRSSYGRTLRRTQHYDPNAAEFGVLSVSYENELDLLAILHLRETPDMPASYGIGVAHHDLVVSLYDNVSGTKINSVVVERDITPSEIFDTAIIMDEDTIIYTRSEMQSTTQDLVNYKIMRFCRKH